LKPADGCQRRWPLSPLGCSEKPKPVSLPSCLWARRNR
jgi:hypothetical protein